MRNIINRSSIAGRNKGGECMRVITMIVIVGILLAISIIDFKIKIIPNQLNVLLLMSGIWSSFVFQEITLLNRFLGIFSVSIPMLILVVLCSGGLGGGDIKLMAASGMLLGTKWNIFAACAGLFLGGLYGFFLLITKRAERKECFALGPFLCIGIAAVFFKYIFIKA